MTFSKKIYTAISIIAFLLLLLIVFTPNNQTKQSSLTPYKSYTPKIANTCKSYSYSLSGDGQLIATLSTHEEDIGKRFHEKPVTLNITNNENQQSVFSLTDNITDFNWALDGKSIFITIADKGVAQIYLNTDGTIEKFTTKHLVSSVPTNTYNLISDAPTLALSLPLLHTHSALFHLIKGAEIQPKLFSFSTENSYHRKTLPHQQQDGNYEVTMKQMSSINWWLNHLGEPIARVDAVPSATGRFKEFTLETLSKVNQGYQATHYFTIPSNYLYYMEQIPVNNIYPFYSNINNEIKYEGFYSTLLNNKNTSSLYINTLESNYEKKFLYNNKYSDIHLLILSRFGELIGVLLNTDKYTFEPLSLKGEQLKAAIDRVNNHVFDEEVLSISDNGEKAIFQLNNTSLSKTYLFDFSSQSLSEIPDDCIERNIKTESYKQEKSDGVSITSYLHKPENFNENTPVIINLHGGPHTRDFLIPDTDTFVYLDNGFAVLNINYRGSTGGGKKLQNSLFVSSDDVLMQDIIDALMYVKETNQWSPSATVLAGGSFGGYLTLFAATSSQWSDYFDAFLSVAGAVDLGKLFQFAVHPFNTPVYTQRIENSIELTPLYDRHITHNKPIYVVWGEEDKTVPPSYNSELFVKQSSGNIHAFNIKGMAHNLYTKDSLNKFNDIIDTLKNNLQ